MTFDLYFFMKLLDKKTTNVISPMEEETPFARPTYRVLATFNGKFKQLRQIRHFELTVSIFGHTLLVDSYWIHCYGQYDALDPTDIYLNSLLALDYPKLFDANTLEKDRRHLRRMIVPAAGDEPPRRSTPLFES